MGQRDADDGGTRNGRADGTTVAEDGGTEAGRPVADGGRPAAVGEVQRSEGSADDLSVLSLVTNHDSQFYRAQVETLERAGVHATTLPVPGEHEYGATDESDGGQRSLLDYCRYVPQVIARSLGDYDLVHANYGLTAPAALAQVRLPVVLSLWGSDLMGQYGAVSRWCARHCDAVIVMSEDMADRLDRECHVVPHGLDLEQFRPIDPERARERVGWNPDASHVLFPYPPNRDVKDFPRAKRVVERARDAVAGPVELQIASGVPHEEMPYLVNAADCLLLTSKREGSPNTVKEAMACNTPVVATDVGDVRERLDGVEPSAVGATDEELAAATADVLKRGERSNGRRAIEHLSQERMGERIRAVYREVLDE